MAPMFSSRPTLQLVCLLCVASAALLMLSSHDMLTWRRQSRIEAMSLPLPMSEDISVEPSPLFAIKLQQTHLPEPSPSLAMNRLHQQMRLPEQLASPEMHRRAFHTPSSTMSIQQKHQLHRQMILEETPAPSPSVQPVFDANQCEAWLCQRNPSVTDNAAALWNWLATEHTDSEEQQARDCISILELAHEKKKQNEATKASVQDSVYAQIEQQKQNEATKASVQDSVYAQIEQQKQNEATKASVQDSVYAQIEQQNKKDDVANGDADAIKDDKTNSATKDPSGGGRVLLQATADVVSWTHTDSCKFGVSSSPQAMEEKAQQMEEEAEYHEQNKEWYQKGDPLQEAKGRIRLNGDRANPNAQAFAPVAPGTAKCSDLHTLPGIAFLSSGYDPEATPGCRFDECRTRKIFEFTHNTCRTVHTPGGTYKIPDQIDVLNKYETKASTKVYNSESEYEWSTAIHAGGSYSQGPAMRIKGKVSTEFGKSGGSQKYVAVRKIDSKLYSMRVQTSSGSLGLNREFLMDAYNLPSRFNDNPHQFLRFLRKWGRFSMKSATYGGTLVLKLTSSGSDSAGQFALSANLEFDMLTGSGSAGASVGVDQKNSGAEATSKAAISIEANGGDPTIAAAITDVVPGAHESASFRSDFVAWLQSVPRFPRLTERIPYLEPISRALPSETPGLASDCLTAQVNATADLDCDQKIKLDRLQWVMRKRALEQASSVMSTHPHEAMHADHQECDTKEFIWRDYNRFSLGDCVAFTARTDGPVQMMLSDSIRESDGNVVVVTYGTEWSTIDLMESGSKTEIWKTDDPRATAMGSKDLAGRFWFCMTADKEGTTLQFGVRENSVTSRTVDIILRPRFFALKCPEFGTLSHIGVWKASTFLGLLSEENKLDLQAADEWSVANSESNTEFTIRSAASAACWTVVGIKPVMTFSSQCTEMGKDVLWRLRANSALKHVKSGLCVQKPTELSEDYVIRMGEDCSFPVKLDNTAPSADHDHYWAGPNFFNVIAAEENKRMCVHPDTPESSDIGEGMELVLKANCESSATGNWLACREGFPCNDNRAMLETKTMETTCFNAAATKTGGDKFAPECPDHFAISAFSFGGTCSESLKMSLEYVCSRHRNLLSSEIVKSTDCVEGNPWELHLLPLLGFSCDTGHALAEWKLSKVPCPDNDKVAFQYTCAAAEIVGTRSARSECKALEKDMPVNTLDGIAVKCPDQEVMTGLTWDKTTCPKGEMQAVVSCAKLVLPAGETNNGFEKVMSALTPTADEASECLPDIKYNFVNALAKTSVAQKVTSAQCPQGSALTGFEFSSTGCASGDQNLLPTSTQTYGTERGKCVTADDTLVTATSSNPTVPAHAAMRGFRFNSDGCSWNQLTKEVEFIEWESAIGDQESQKKTSCVPFKVSNPWRPDDGNNIKDNLPNTLDRKKMASGLMGVAMDCGDDMVMSSWTTEACTIGDEDGVRAVFTCKSMKTTDKNGVWPNAFLADKTVRYDKYNFDNFWDSPLEGLPKWQDGAMCQDGYAIQMVKFKEPQQNNIDSATNEYGQHVEAWYRKAKKMVKCGPLFTKKCPENFQDHSKEFFIPKTVLELKCAKLKAPMAATKLISQCASCGASLIGSESVHETKCGRVDGFAQLLAGFTVKCPFGNALTSWRFVAANCKADEALVEFKCRPADVANEPASVDSPTCKEFTGQPLSVLEEVFPKCSTDHVMTGFTFTSIGCSESQGWKKARAFCARLFQYKDTASKN